MAEQTTQTRIAPNGILRLVLEIFAFFSFSFWGFSAWPGPWQNWLFGIATPLFALLVWALFRSPKAVFQLDAFGKALIEIFIMGSAALTWLTLGQPIVATVFGIVAATSGVIAGRKEIPR